MDWFATWITKFNINDLPGTLVLLLLLYGVYKIFNDKLWPFVTGQWWPAFVKNQETRLAMEVEAEKQRNTLLVTMRDAMIELRTTVTTFVAFASSNASEQRDVLNTLVAQQQGIMQQLKTVAVPANGEAQQ